MFLAAIVNCGGNDGGSEDISSSTGQAMSSTVRTTYGVTSFGGPGDYQRLACGGNSRTVNQWYVASSQRYGCNKHLKLTANGKCAVVYTGDAGPASWVESKAGTAILDSSPTVGKYFFGDGSLGWSDLKSHPGKYVVHVEVTSLPLGPCSASGGGGTSGGGTSSGGTTHGGGTTGGGGTGAGGDDTGGDDTGGGDTGGGDTGGGDTGGASGGGSCSTDGDCNPGNDGSGKICQNGSCVPGCHQDNQCPGSTSCVDGSCQ